MTGWSAVASAAVAAAALALVHALARRFEEALSVVPRSRWLSFGGGVAVAYVFVHLLPEIARSQGELEREGVLSAAVARELWLGALAGLVVMYGLERLAEDRAGEGGDAVRWLHLGSYAVYNAIAGYLLVEQARGGVPSLALFAVAIGVHFLVNDHALVERHGPLYRRGGRWVVAVAVLAGWAVAVVAQVPPAAVGGLLAFLGGGVVLNTVKEELPAERRSRFGTFAAASAGYAALLLAV